MEQFYQGGETDLFLECSLNSLDKGTQLVSIPNVEVCHNQGELEKEDIGRNILVSTNKEDKSKRLSEFDVVIYATKAATADRLAIGGALVENHISSPGIENTHSLDSLFRE